MANVLPKGSLFILIARNTDRLQEVSDQIKQCDGMNAVFHMYDQSKADGSANKKLFEDCLLKAGASQKDFEQFILINNAGTLEPLEFVRDLDQIGLDKINDYFNINLSGCITLTSSFLRMFGSTQARVIVNISSIAAVMPMKSWLLYCMGLYI